MKEKTSKTAVIYTRARRQRAVSRIEPQLARLRSALLEGVFSAEEYAAEKDRLTSELAEHRVWLESHDASSDHRSECIDILIGVFTNPAELIEGLTVAQTKDLVRIVFGKLTLTPKKKIEPAQDSVYTILTSANAGSFPDGADHGKKIETVISIVAEAAMAIKSLLRAA